MSEGANDVAPPLLITQLSETAGLIFAGNYQINRGKMAERVGFEPTEPLQAQRFSRPPRSTTPAPLRAFGVVAGI